MSSTPETPQPRQSGRVPLEAEITMRRAGFPNFRVQIDDISAEGCRVEFVDRPNLNERVWVKFEGLTAVEGSVVWVKDRSAGIKFDHAIHPAVFDDLIARLR